MRTDDLWLVAIGMCLAGEDIPECPSGRWAKLAQAVRGKDGRGVWAGLARLGVPHGDRAVDAVRSELARRTHNQSLAVALRSLEMAIAADQQTAIDVARGQLSRLLEESES